MSLRVMGRHSSGAPTSSQGRPPWERGFPLGWQKETAAKPGLKIGCGGTQIRFCKESAKCPNDFTTLTRPKQRKSWFRTSTLSHCFQSKQLIHYEKLDRCENEFPTLVCSKQRRSWFLKSILTACFQPKHFILKKNGTKGHNDFTTLSCPKQRKKTGFLHPILLAAFNPNMSF